MGDPRLANGTSRKVSINLSSGKNENREKEIRIADVRRDEEKTLADF
jgi:hypothetical protein